VGGAGKVVDRRGDCDIPPQRPIGGLVRGQPRSLVSIAKSRADLPVQLSTKVELIKPETTNALGLTVPLSLLGPRR